MDSLRLLIKLDTQTLRNWPTIPSFLTILLLSLLSLLTTFLTNWRPPSLLQSIRLANSKLPQFFTDRYRFYNKGIHSSKTGNLSFFFGKHHLTGLSGVEARRAFFENKAVDMTKRSAVFLTVTAPTLEDAKPDKWFARYLFGFMKNEQLEKSIPLVVTDVRATHDQLALTSSPLPNRHQRGHNRPVRLDLQASLPTNHAHPGHLILGLFLLSHALQISEMVRDNRQIYLSHPDYLPRLPTLNHFKTTASAQLYFAVKDEFEHRQKKKKEKKKIHSWQYSRSLSLSPISWACNPKGRHMSEAPETNRSNHTSSGPDTPVRLKYKLREQQ
ncbi:hypothetical protein QBC32DRAFT_312496 [Pseudoneurospora amorphoporcata]|uniref:Uncharacterized protein n=1 Tax=Pseudoneurospora amorphoporcata TaxID=241081 RepID=A0AAN6NXZ4_9PEZI|nr:hypothetical protein QBC32DRAFT_312496 [Pseudoneurospora amorphoporcata]